MPILRAGPFASSADSFVDEPDLVSISIVPVNCAKDTTSADWPWRHYKQIRQRDNGTLSITFNDYVNGLISITESESFTASRNSSGQLFTDAKFYYQASADFSMTLTYDISASITGTSGSAVAASASILVTVGATTEVDNSNASGVILDAPASASVSGTVSLAIPSAVVPMLVSITVLSSGSNRRGDRTESTTNNVSLSLS